MPDQPEFWDAAAAYILALEIVVFVAIMFAGRAIGKLFDRWLK